MPLTAVEGRELATALVDAYPTATSLAEMLDFELDKRLETISHGSTPTEIIFDLIRTADAEGWLDKLLTAAQRHNTENPKLQEFYQKYFTQTENVGLPGPPKETQKQINRDTTPNFYLLLGLAPDEPWNQSTFERVLFCEREHLNGVVVALVLEQRLSVLGVI